MLEEMLSNPLVKLARETLERGVRSVLQAANLPTSDDVAELKRRLGELEAMLDDLGRRMGRRGPGAGPGGGGEDGEPGEGAGRGGSRSGGRQR